MSGFKPDTFVLKDFETKPVVIPEGFIIQREALKALNGMDFIKNSNEGKPCPLKGISYKVFIYYYNIWNDFHWTKILPHGRGTLHEPRWLIDIIIIFSRAYKATQNILAIKEKNAGG